MAWQVRTQAAINEQVQYGALLKPLMDGMEGLQQRLDGQVLARTRKANLIDTAQHREQALRKKHGDEYVDSVLERVLSDPQREGQATHAPSLLGNGRVAASAIGPLVDSLLSPEEQRAAEQAITAHQVAHRRRYTFGVPGDHAPPPDAAPKSDRQPSPISSARSMRSQRQIGGGHADKLPLRKSVAFLDDSPPAKAMEGGGASDPEAMAAIPTSADGLPLIRKNRRRPLPGRKARHGGARIDWTLLDELEAEKERLRQEKAKKDPLLPKHVRIQKPAT